MTLADRPNCDNRASRMGRPSSDMDRTLYDALNHVFYAHALNHIFQKNNHCFQQKKLKKFKLFLIFFFENFLLLSTL